MRKDRQWEEKEPRRGSRCEFDNDEVRVQQYNEVRMQRSNVGSILKVEKQTDGGNAK